MSGRADVRLAIQQYFQAASIPYVGAVYPARTYINEQDYITNMMGEAVQSATGSGCVLVVNLTDDTRQRRADTGRGAVNDTYIHRVALELFFGNISGDPVATQMDYDVTVDAIVTAIRANATWGSANGLVWSSGEYAPFIRHEQSMVTTTADGMTTQIPGVVWFEAWEWIAGPAGS